MLKLTFYGAAGEVGRSCILLESKGTKILLDAGVKIGEHDEYPLIPDEDLGSIDGIIISHAHLDHSGYLPHIYSTGYEGYTYTLKPTFELTNVLVSDYVRISNPSNITKEGIAKMQKHHRLVEYHSEFAIKNLKIKLVPAGHILGSAMIEVDDGEKRLLYTGDVNFRSTKMLDPAYTEHLHADALITESTYAGEKDAFEPERKVIDSMVTSMNETIKQGGKVIVPGFASGRAQEVLLQLDDYIRSGVLQKVPIYIDGMINKAMRIHRHNVIYCRDELQKRILLNEDDPFKSPNFNPVTTRQQRSKIMTDSEACIIVTTSGMLTGGPVIRYLQRLGGQAQNKMILVGYQAVGTLGRAIQDGAKEVKIEGKRYPVKLKVETFHLSAHADKRQLLSFMGRIEGLRHVFIVHGELHKSKELQESLKNKYDAVVPSLGEDFTL